MTKEKIIELGAIVVAVIVATAIGVAFKESLSPTKVEVTVEQPDYIPTPVGNIASQYVRYTTSADVYFGTSGGTRTATQTPITLTTIEDVDTVAVTIFNTATSSTNLLTSSVWIQPQISIDGQRYTDIAPAVITSASGAALTSIQLANASTSVYEYTPRSLGTSSVQFILQPVVGRYFRLKAWTSGTSTVILQAVEQVRQTR